MKFLTKALANSLGPKDSLIGTIVKTLGKKYPSRGHERVHASDITKEKFCAREVALLDLTKGKRKDKFTSAALQATFDIGNVTGDLVREKWLGQKAIGHWRCRICNEKVFFSRKPAETVETSPHVHDWKYHEVAFNSVELGFQGSIDVFADIGAPKLSVVELKILNPDDFASINAPLAEHRLRTSLYMKLIECSKSSYIEKINLQTARVLYVSRAFGKAHPDHDNEILPFKEFLVHRDDSILADPLGKAALVKKFRKDGTLPPQICKHSWGPDAKFCPVVVPCFGYYAPPAEPLPAEAAAP